MKGVNNEIEKLKDIPKRKYVGYIWMSDKAEPEVLKQPTDYDFADITINPFVQEALLYCEVEKISVMIRHTGKYQISEFHLNELPEEAVLEEKKYYTHRLDKLNLNHKKINFKQLWLPKKDPNCENMEVLTLKAHIFTGFKESKN